MSQISISSVKPRLTFWQIWNMSFGFLGIQFGFALQNANVSRIFETLGASKDELPILLKLHYTRIGERRTSWNLTLLLVILIFRNP